MSHEVQSAIVDCVDGSVDCAALTTSTTTTFNSDCDFDSDSRASNFDSKQTLSSSTCLPQHRAEEPVSRDQRNRKILLIQDLFFPNIEPEPPPENDARHELSPYY